MRLKTRALAAAGGVGTACLAVAGYVGVVTARISLDLGIGRRTRPLGPIVLDVAAPPETVYAAAAAPYAERRTRAMREKVDILTRTDRMLLAAHRTPVGLNLTAVTVETVTLDPPSRMGFRLVRGPVPLVTETFDFEPTPAGTRFTYTGEMATDLGWLGERWGDLVERSWVGAVRTSMRAIQADSERPRPL